jgi:hypothetical protein
VAKWEYCKIVEPTKLSGAPVEPARLLFMGASKEEEADQQIDTPEHVLARLGKEGWELVSHSQLFAPVEGSGVLPVMEVYYLKRELG